MVQWVRDFWTEEKGQDLIEYSLLIAFIALACAALLGSGQPAINGMWHAGNSRLSEAMSAASGPGGSGG